MITNTVDDLLAELLYSIRNFISTLHRGKDKKKAQDHVLKCCAVFQSVVKCCKVL